VDVHRPTECALQYSSTCSCFAKSTYFCFIFSSLVGQKTMPLQSQRAAQRPALLGVLWAL
jgi:hypothetical protein